MPDHMPTKSGTTFTKKIVSLVTTALVPGTEWFRSNVSKLFFSIDYYQVCTENTRQSQGQSVRVLLAYFILGLHSSIATHLSYYYYFETGEWGPNRDVFMERVGNYPERIENLELVFLFMLRAVAKIAPYLEKYEFCTGTPRDRLTVAMTVSGPEGVADCLCLG